MQIFNLKPSAVIGEIKNSIKEAILEGEIKNEYAEVLQYLLKLGKTYGLVPSLDYKSGL